MRASWRLRGASPAELGWVDDVAVPGRADHRLRPPGADLQAAHADAARPGAAASRLLTDPERPVQLVIAGKSHPADDAGQAAHPAARAVRRRRRRAAPHRVPAELRHRDGADACTRAATSGSTTRCARWRRPARPGMKSALNGGLNLSILDGWWDEWFDGENGWAIPTADGVDDPDRRDDLEAAALYDLVEHSVARAVLRPRRATGCRCTWLEMVRHTLATLGPEGAGHAHGRASTSSGCTRPRRWPAARSRPTGRRARASPRGRPGCARQWPHGAGRPRGVRRRRRRAAGRRRAARAGVRVARRR